MLEAAGKDVPWPLALGQPLPVGHDNKPLPVEEKPRGLGAGAAGTFQQSAFPLLLCRPTLHLAQGLPRLGQGSLVLEASSALGLSSALGPPSPLGPPLSLRRRCHSSALPPRWPDASVLRDTPAPQFIPAGMQMRGGSEPCHWPSDQW